MALETLFNEDGTLNLETKENLKKILVTVLTRSIEQDQTINSVIDHAYTTREMNLAKTTTLPTLMLQFKMTESENNLLRKMMEENDQELLLRHQTSQSALQVASSTQEQLNLLRTSMIDIIKRNNALERENGRQQHELENMKIELDSKDNLIKQYDAFLHEIQNIANEPSNEAAMITELKKHIQNLDIQTG